MAENDKKSDRKLKMRKGQRVKNYPDDESDVGVDRENDPDDKVMKGWRVKMILMHQR